VCVCVFRDGRSYVSLTHQKTRPPDPMMAAGPPPPQAPPPARSAVFVPPFLKRRRVDSPQTGPDPQDYSPRTRTPAVFIPPFKKRPQSAPEIPAPPAPPPPAPPPPSPTATETGPYVPPAAVATKSPVAVTESHGRHGDETDGVPEESAAAAGDLATENHGNPAERQGLLYWRDVDVSMATPEP